MNFLFEPDAPAAVHSLLPIAAAHPPFTYVFMNKGPATGLGSRGWYIRDTKNAQWLKMVDEGVPENYRLELLLLQAAYP